MAVAHTDTDTAVEMIALDRIRAEGNVRSALGDVTSLAQSIARHGVLTAVTVAARFDGDYDLIAGFRRVAAAQQAGLSVIPAVVRGTADAAETLRQRLAENVDREGLSDIDTGEAIQQLLGLGVSVDDVAATVQTRPENVQAWADLLRLPKKIRARIGKGMLSAQEAYPLTTLLDDPKTLRAAVQHIDDGWAVDQAVSVVTRDRDRERALVAAAEKLAAEGCPVIDPPKWGHFDRSSKTQRLGKHAGEVNIPLRQHAKLPCHAAYISSYASNDIVYVCTNRSAHAGEEGSGVPDLKAERAAARATKKALREAEKKRLDAVRDAARNGTISRDTAVDHVLRLALGDASHKDVDRAWEILGLPDAEHAVYRRDAVIAHAERNSESLLDAVLAIALARGERALAVDNWDTRGGVLPLHVALIRGAGIHEFSTEEERLIAERSPRGWEYDDADAADVRGEDADEHGPDASVEGAA